MSEPTTNAQSSTRRGPNTEEGKRRVSLNALKHGLNAKSPQAVEVIEKSAGVDYEVLLDKVRSHYWPADQIEDMLCKRIARCQWRLAQLEAMEQRLLDTHSDRTRPGHSYESILKNERMVSLEMHRSIRSIAEKRAAEKQPTPRAASTRSQYVPLRPRDSHLMERPSDTSHPMERSNEEQQILAHETRRSGERW